MKKILKEKLESTNLKLFGGLFHTGYAGCARSVCLLSAGRVYAVTDAGVAEGP